METDRKLLELAAKAACMIVEPVENGWNEIYPMGWNPISKDADAFRLMVDLNLMNANLRFFGEANRYAATRRAIVLAAAEIGRSMK